MFHIVASWHNKRNFFRPKKLDSHVRFAAFDVLLGCYMVRGSDGGRQEPLGNLRNIRASRWRKMWLATTGALGVCTKRYRTIQMSAAAAAAVAAAAAAACSTKHELGF